MIPSVGEGKFGLSPAASKIYQVKKGVSLGGYGEMIYNNQAREDQSGTYSGNQDTIDFVRQIVYLGYRFNEHFLLNSEIEFEHGSTENGGSVSVEFAYLDYLHKDLLNFRAGMLLMPMGLINEFHEPTTFLSTYRPQTERTILPSTWRENGVGVFGARDLWSYKLYVVNSFNAAGFSADKGFREGRQNGAEASAHDFAGVGRIDYLGTKGLMTGVSFFSGQTGQNQFTATGGSIKGWANIVDAHLDYKMAGFQLRGLMAYSHLQGADQVNQLAGLTGSDSVASDMMGYYAELGYDVLNHKNTEHKLVPFFRYEKLNTQMKVPTGFAKNPANNREIHTIGLSYMPVVNIVLKANYEIQRNKASTGVNQWNLGLGYIF
ncbi:MAG: porin [Bdellovibrionota bacterium]